MNNSNRKATILLSVGLIGISAYQLVVRATHLSLLQKDIVHGLWLGFFLGIEIFGVFLFIKARRQPSA